LATIDVPGSLFFPHNNLLADWDALQPIAVAIRRIR
jgi:hypothetical protein